MCALVIYRSWTGRFADLEISNNKVESSSMLDFKEKKNQILHKLKKDFLLIHIEAFYVLYFLFS